MQLNDELKCKKTMPSGRASHEAFDVRSVAAAVVQSLISEKFDDSCDWRDICASN